MCGAFTVPPQGRKRQAAPSLRRTYREHRERVNQEWAGDIETAASVAVAVCPP